MSTPESRHPSGLTEAEIWHQYTRYPSLLAKITAYGLIIGIIYLLFRSVEDVLFPVLLSLLVAYLLDPLVDRFEAKGWSRTTTIGLFLAVGLSGIVLFVLFLYPTISHQISRAIDGMPRLLQQGETELLPWIETTAHIDLPDTFSAALAAYSDTVQGQLPNLAGAAKKGVQALITQLAGVMASAVNIVMIPVFTFYFLRDFDHLRLSLAELLPQSNRSFVLSRIVLADEVVGAWFRGQVEVALILAAMYGTTLSVLFGWSGIGFGAGLAIGIMAGVLNVIPYFGFLIGFSLSVLMVLLDWNGASPLVGVLLIFAIVQGIEGYIITPRVVGEKVGLSPVIVIIALLLGGEILGLVGVLLALPVAGIIRVLIPDFIEYYHNTTFYTGRVGELEPITARPSKDPTNHTVEAPLPSETSV